MQQITMVNIVRFLGILFILTESSGFLSPSPLLRRLDDKSLNPRSSDDNVVAKTLLFAQRKRASKNKKKSNGKNPVASKRTSSKRSASGWNKDSSPKTAQKKKNDNSINVKSSIQIPGKNPKTSVPWQVLSTKDAKKNVEKEKERRRLGLSEQVHDDNIESMSISKNFLSDTDQTFLKWKRFNPTTIPKGMQLIASVLDNKMPPRIGVPEIAFLGRSNVGKSSLLNKLSSYSAKSAGADKARVGKTPGATASVNLYALLDKAEKPILGLVDLPGFGYAKLSKTIQQSVQRTAERYLGNRKELVLGILLLDIRRVPSDDDKAVLAALYDLNLPILVVATKTDKISSKAELETRLENIRLVMGLPVGQPLCISSMSGEGTKMLWQIIMEACETGVEEFERQLQLDDDDQEFAQEDEPFEDGNDIAYDQGYDWIHDSAIMYDYGDDDDWEEEEQAYYSPSDDINDSEIMPEKENIKSLKQRARRMERSGEV